MKKIYILILIISITIILNGCNKNCEHDNCVWKGYEATCTATGLTDGVKCSKCGKVIEERETTPMKDHEYGEFISVSSTKHKHICKNCGDVQIGDHKYGQKILIEENPETGKAKTKFVCSVCNHEEIIEHSIGAIVFPPVSMN